MLIFICSRIRHSSMCLAWTGCQWAGTRRFIRR
jgi:hypothetical protein